MLIQRGYGGFNISSCVIILRKHIFTCIQVKGRQNFQDRMTRRYKYNAYQKHGWEFIVS
jgi:hypothetical protein